MLRKYLPLSGGLSHLPHQVGAGSLYAGAGDALGEVVVGAYPDVQVGGVVADSAACSMDGLLSGEDLPERGMYRPQMALNEA